MNKTGPYRIDPSFVEHSCCWVTAIVRDVPEGDGNYGFSVELVCECKESHAEAIVEALNGVERLRGELADKDSRGLAKCITANSGAYALVKGGE